jgi:hypothetical protein
MKINFTSNGKITWEEFCTFMQLNFAEKEETNNKQKEVVFILPAKMEISPHRTPIQKISCTSDFNYMILSSVSYGFTNLFCCLIYIKIIFSNKDGIVSVWSQIGELKRVKKDVVNKKLEYYKSIMIKTNNNY